MGNTEKLGDLAANRSSRVLLPPSGGDPALPRQSLSPAGSILTVKSAARASDHTPVVLSLDQARRL
jgi:hypothetical protein